MKLTHLRESEDNQQDNREEFGIISEDRQRFENIYYKNFILKYFFSEFISLKEKA